MSTPIKVAIIGLDTSHSVELPKLMLDSAVAPELRMTGMVSTRALRFDTPFQLKEGLDKRQAYLESIGMMVTTDFDTAVADCDAILLEINDPAFHLEYFRKCAGLGKPIFLDKPFADTLDNAREIMKIAAESKTVYFTASCLRFCPAIQEAHKSVAHPKEGFIWGPLGKAMAGSSIVWYGVHATEMLEFVMGPGAISVQACANGGGYMLVVNYADGRRGVISLGNGCYQYGGVLRDLENTPLIFNETISGAFYRPLLVQVEEFFRTGKMPVEIEDSFEVMAILDAADKSALSGRPEPIYRS